VAEHGWSVRIEIPKFGWEDGILLKIVCPEDELVG
jgi:hypothetical protein